MTARLARSISVALLLGVFSIVPAAILLERIGEPASTAQAVGLLLSVLMSPTCLLLLAVFSRAVRKRMNPSPEVLARLRITSFMFGPLGWVRAVFVLTEEPPSLSSSQVPRGRQK